MRMKGFVYIAAASVLLCLLTVGTDDDSRFSSLISYLYFTGVSLNCNATKILPCEVLQEVRGSNISNGSVGT